MTPRRKIAAKSILATKVVLHNAVIVEMKIWEVPKDERFPQGYKYSLFAVMNGQVLVGYDNHHPKGHHRHIEDKELPYPFNTLESLKSDFKADLVVQLKKAGSE
jgi:hypothetical protein